MTFVIDGMIYEEGEEGEAIPTGQPAPLTQYQQEVHQEHDRQVVDEEEDAMAEQQPEQQPEQEQGGRCIGCGLMQHSEGEVDHRLPSGRVLGVRCVAHQPMPTSLRRGIEDLQRGAS